jgi:hypothetical protein
MEANQVADLAIELRERMVSLERRVLVMEMQLLEGKFTSSNDHTTLVKRVGNLEMRGSSNAGRSEPINEFVKWAAGILALVIVGLLLSGHLRWG